MTDQLAAPTVTDGAERARDPVIATSEAPRYPGSPPFGDSDLDRLLFRGRAREVDDVLHSILSHDLFLLYAVSGMGKTSLLRAGVFEELRRREYFPVIVRLNDPSIPPVELIDVQIREAGAMSEGIDITRMPGDAPRGPPDSLWDLLAGLEIWRANTLQQVVLVFDQFEELFTLGWDDDQRERFIEEFGEVVRRHRVAAPERSDDTAPLPPPNVKMVLSMREDFLGQLEALAVHVPQIMHRRFRLEGLSPEQAESAVREPAAVDDPRLRSHRFTYSAGAAGAILTFLRTKEERGEEVLTRWIDPSQLQIICQHVERSVLPGKAAPADAAAVVEITADDLGGREGLERIVGDFYRRVIESFPRHQRNALRQLCETGLISRAGRRLSLEEGEISSRFGVAASTLAQLVDHRLLRSEPRVGSVYYELAHDTLTAPILAYRESKRHARRRRAAIVALALGAIGAAVLIAALASRLGADEERGVSATRIPLERTMSGTLESPGVPAVFEFESDEGEQVMVTVRPEGFDAVLEVTRLEDDAVGETAQFADWQGFGGPETAVAGGARGTYRATVRGSAAGTFDLTVRPVSVRELALGEPLRNQRLAAAAPAVLAVEVADRRPFVVTVRPDSGLDAVVELFDPAGRSLPWDATGVGEPETLVGGGAPGRYLVVLRSLAGGSGSFEVTARLADVTTVPVGSTVSGTIAPAGEPSVLEFELAADDTVAVTLTGAGDEGELDVAAPDGSIVASTFGWGGAASSVVGGRDGHYLAYVRGAPGSEFTLSVVPAVVTELDIGDVAQGSIDDSGTVAVYEFTTGGEGPIVVEVASDENLDAVVDVTGPTESEVVDNVATDDVERVLVDGDDGERHVVTVSAYEGTFGSFQVSVRSSTVTELTVGEPIVGRMRPGDLAVYDVASSAERPLVIQAVGSGDLALELEASASDGSLLPSYGEAAALLDASVAPGPYRAIVRAVESAGDFEISVEPAEVVELVDGVARTVELDRSRPAVFEFQAAPGQTSTITMTPSDGMDAELAVTDGSGYEVAYAISAAGEPATTVLGSSTGGVHRAVVATWGDVAGPLTLLQRRTDVADVVVGTTGRVPLGAAGDVAVFQLPQQPGLLVVNAVSGPGLKIDLDVIDEFGNSIPFISNDGGTLLVDDSYGRLKLVAVDLEGSGDLDVIARAAEPTDVTIGEPVQGTIGSPGDVGVFRFEATGGRPPVVTVVPTDALDAVVTVVPTDPLDAPEVAYDPAGLQTDERTAGGTETIEVDPLLGRLLVVVSGADGSTGTYDVVVSPN